MTPASATIRDAEEESKENTGLNLIIAMNYGSQREIVEAANAYAKDVLEGKLREIISKMTVEEIYKDREKFASQVQEVAAVGLAGMGLELKAFTIRDISDKNGYLEALGKPRIAEVKMNASIAEAEALKETQIKQSLRPAGRIVLLQPQGRTPACDVPQGRYVVTLR